MKNNDLPKRLKALGFPLFETAETEDANLALADVVRSKDLRLWEGFPVVLATGAERGILTIIKPPPTLNEDRIGITCRLWRRCRLPCTKPLA